MTIRLAIVCLGVLPWLSSGDPITSVPFQSKATLYSVNKHKTDERNCLNLQPRVVGRLPGLCDVRYGSLYINHDLDWFETSAADGNRSIIKDLGLLTWDQNIAVPVVEPLPKLKPGETRLVSIDVSGADGADGASGAPAKNGASADGVVRSTSTYHKKTATVIQAAPSKPKHDGKPKIDPMFVKVIVGHMYVIHVVDDLRDFYALFRVEAIERRDNCTVSWQLVQAPETSARQSQR
ncbi:MAG: hypothetical protein ACREBC_24650 [Pyrinomonadaceae bacterium]